MQLSDHTQVSTEFLLCCMSDYTARLLLRGYENTLTKCINGEGVETPEALATGLSVPLYYAFHKLNGQLLALLLTHRVKTNDSISGEAAD
jgi:hypothetical protein